MFCWYGLCPVILGSQQTSNAQAGVLKMARSHSFSGTQICLQNIKNIINLAGEVILGRQGIVPKKKCEHNIFRIYHFEKATMFSAGGNRHLSFPRFQKKVLVQML